MSTNNVTGSSSEESETSREGVAGGEKGLTLSDSCVKVRAEAFLSTGTSTVLACLCVTES